MAFERGHPIFFDVISLCQEIWLTSNPIERHLSHFEGDLTALFLAECYSIHYLRQQNSFVYEKNRYYCLLDSFSDYSSTDNYDACRKSVFLKSIVCGNDVPAWSTRRSVYAAKNLL